MERMFAEISLFAQGSRLAETPPLRHCNVRARPPVPRGRVTADEPHRRRMRRAGVAAAHCSDPRLLINLNLSP